MSNKRLVQLRIIGKVQGVFYRVTAKRKADDLGLSGFVRNEEDGSVYLEAVGEEEALYKFIKWCNMGPSGAVVEKVDVNFLTAKEFDGFNIHR